jgi:hypothetical protein
MRGTISTLVGLITLALLLGFGASPLTADEAPNGKPFESLQSQIDELVGQSGSRTDRLSAAESALAQLQALAAANHDAIGALDDRTAALEQEIDGILAQLEHTGTMVEPGLYDVYSRVLWDVGWLKDDTYLSGGFFTYNEYPRPLVYANNQTTFLGPFGYGVPPVPPGATRKARLYVIYGHQYQCNGDPTVSIGDLEFTLPQVGGYYGHPAAGWSNFRLASEYAGIGHVGIQVHLKNFSWGGPDCGPYPGADRPKGVVYHLEIHFYDEFPP